VDDELTTAVLEHDASGFILFSPTGAATDAGSLGRWANEIAPAVREAIGQDTPSRGTTGIVAAPLPPSDRPS
jgi:hypothetical protein